jgi:hypothetical protein
MIYALTFVSPRSRSLIAQGKTVDPDGGLGTSANLWNIRGNGTESARQVRMIRRLRFEAVGNADSVGKETVEIGDARAQSGVNNLVHPQGK